MPLVGFLCELTHKPVSFEECLGCARTKHPCQFVYEILNAMAVDPEIRKNIGISVTSCTGCTRQGYYALATDYYQYPHCLWPAMRGTALHSLLEANPEPDIYYEHRFSMPMTHTMLSGQVDKLILYLNSIVDFKTKEKLPTVVPEEYIWQINAYRLLLSNGEVVSFPKNAHRHMNVGDKVAYDITRLGLFFMSGMEVGKFAVPVKPLEEIYDYFDKRVSQIYLARNEEAPLPDRMAPDPSINKLCVNWCPFFDICKI